MKISLVIPFYNEEKQIPTTLNAVIPIMNSLDYDYEILLVDDGSKDQTWQMIDQFSSYTRPENPHGLRGVISGISFSRNFGKEAAICAGLHYASGDAVILMDGDLQHPPHYIPKMIEIWEKEGIDVVEGVKSSRGKESLKQKLNAFLFYKFFRKASGYDLENASDFKLLDKKVVQEWRRLGEHDMFFRALSAWLGFKRKSFEFEVLERAHGQSKWPLFKLAKLSIDAITSFSALPLQIITFMGMASLLISVILGIQTVFRWATGTAADGFTTVILLQLAIGGLIMVSLGLIGIYIARIFTEVKARPRYIVSRFTSSASSKDVSGSTNQ